MSDDGGDVISERRAGAGGAGSRINIYQLCCHAAQQFITRLAHRVL